MASPTGGWRYAKEGWGVARKRMGTQPGSVGKDCEEMAFEQWLLQGNGDPQQVKGARQIIQGKFLDHQCASLF